MIEWLWEGGGVEPFRPTNRIAGTEGSDFALGNIAADAMFLCLDKATGQWWVTNWTNVPKDNPNVEAANLMWAWTKDGEFNPNPQVGDESLRVLMSAKLNDFIAAGGVTGGLPASGITFRSVEIQGNTSTDITYTSTFLSTVAPNLFRHILFSSPVQDTSGRFLTIEHSATIHAASSDQNYIYGLRPEPGKATDISSSASFYDPDWYRTKNNPLEFAITID